MAWTTTWERGSYCLMKGRPQSFFLLYLLCHSRRIEKYSWEPSAPAVLSGLPGHGSGVPLALFSPFRRSLAELFLFCRDTFTLGARNATRHARSHSRALGQVRPTPLRSSEGLWENRAMGAESPFNTMGNNLGARIILLMAAKKISEPDGIVKDVFWP